MANYTDASIYTPKRLEIVRKRPTQFLHSRGIEGLVHAAVEIIANAIDEIALMSESIGQMTVILFFDISKGRFQVGVMDNGRGLPINRLLDSFTELNTSGKFDSAAYAVSSGLFGVGAKVVAGTSLHFRAISYCSDGIGSLYVRQGVHGDDVDRLMIPPSQTGVTVLYEPDPETFTDIDHFHEEGLAQLRLLLQKYCFFSHLNLTLLTHSGSLPDIIWSAPIQQVQNLLASVLQHTQMVFTESQFDRLTWIRAYWGVQRPFYLTYTIQDTQHVDLSESHRGEMHYEVRFFYIKFDLVGGRFGMMNNTAIDDVKSTHFTVLFEVLKQQMAGYIKDTTVRKFFLEQYRVPLCCAVNVKFPGGEPSGTTKHAFHSRPFRSIYEPSLIRLLSSIQSHIFLNAVYLEIASDIEAKYLLATTGTSRVKNTNRLFEELKRPDKFKDCSTADRSQAELFLVEGDSAGGGMEGRNAQTQGFYRLRGKPRNAVDTVENRRESAEILFKANAIYQDIIKIVGLNVAKFDLSSLYFQRIFITTDADDHGYHISSILVGNFYLLCPEMIEAGVVHIVTPPLYGLDWNGKPKQSRVYLRDDIELSDWLIRKIYFKILAIGIHTPQGEPFGCEIQYLSVDHYHVFVKMVLDVGEAITNISNELVLPAMIVEALTYVTSYLDPDHVDPQAIYHKITQYMPFDRVHYDPNGHILILTHGRNDYVVPLQNVSDRLRSTILPLLDQFAWKKLRLYVTTKHTTALRDRPVTIVQLYELLKSFDRMFTINRFKGLGGMPPLDMNRTCMDPAYRRVHQITSLGDVRKIFNLLGDDSMYRKHLLQRT